MGHGKGIDERTQRISDTDFLDTVVGRCSGLSYTHRDLFKRDDDVYLPGPAIGDRVTAIDFDTDEGCFTPMSGSRYLLVGLVGRSDNPAERLA